ncbi:MAG: hypothetical protein MUF68_02135 [Cyclobacteriaceae bacterium]|nr:hypothetical protein [Cyclobacteriaceae bacterium]
MILLCLFMLVLGTQLQAQSKRKKKSKNKQENVTSVDPSFPQEGKYQPKTKKGSRKNRGITYNAQDNFYQQRERVQKDIRRAELELSKPQNSNPQYFGHKRPPKKRPPGKMKYCKVCGLKH